MKTLNILPSIAAGAMALALLTAGGNAAAQETVVVASGNDRVASGPNPFLFNSGLVILGLSYTPALIVAVNSDRSEDKLLYAPVVGPWLDLAARDDDNKGHRTLLVVDGMFQAIGALEIAASLFWINADSGVADAPSTGVDVASIAPVRLSKDGYGLVAAGSF
jgi:hypothetical protein